MYPILIGTVSKVNYLLNIERGLLGKFLNYAVILLSRCYRVVRSAVKEDLCTCFLIFGHPPFLRHPALYLCVNVVGWLVFMQLSGGHHFRLIVVKCRVLCWKITSFSMIFFGISSRAFFLYRNLIWLPYGLFWTIFIDFELNEGAFFFPKIVLGVWSIYNSGNSLLGWYSVTF